MSDTEINVSVYKDIWEAIEESFDRICKVWNEVGLHSQETRENMKKRYIVSCGEALAVHLNNMYHEEDSIKNSLVQSLHEKEEDIRSLCDKLGYDADALWLDKDGNDRRRNKTLRQIEVIVEGAYDELNRKYANQVNMSSQVVEDLKLLYQELGETVEPNFMNPDNFLTERTLAVLNKRMDQVNVVKSKRIEAVKDFVVSLLKRYNTLGISLQNATNSVDKMVLSDSNNLPITKDILTQLIDRLAEVDAMEKERNDIVAGYLTEIQSLWCLLQTPQDKVDSFSANYNGSLTDSSLKFYKDYIDQLHNEVNDKLLELIPSLRNDIENIISYINNYSNVLCTWDLSILAIPEKDFSMDIYEQHHELYEQLVIEKGYLDDVVIHINQRENLIQVNMELEALLKDPSRLTDRRNSHKLLQKQIHLENEVKRMKEVVTELKAAINKYEVEHGDIIMNGHRYSDELRDEETLQPRSTINSVFPRSSIRK